MMILQPKTRLALVVLMESARAEFPEPVFVFHIRTTLLSSRQFASGEFAR